MKLSRFGEKSKVHQKYQNFIRRDPFKPGQMPLDQQKYYKVKHYFGKVAFSLNDVNYDFSDHHSKILKDEQSFNFLYSFCPPAELVNREMGLTLQQFIPSHSSCKSIKLLNSQFSTFPCVCRE